jgi:hypothetical protein
VQRVNGAAEDLLPSRRLLRTPPVPAGTHPSLLPDFSRARGYIECGRIPNYPVGHIHLRKRLTPGELMPWGTDPRPQHGRGLGDDTPT